jgi:hypothetical protein
VGSKEHGVITEVGRPVIARLLAGHKLFLGLGVGTGTRPESEEDCCLAGNGDPSTAWHAPLDFFPQFSAGALELQASFDFNEACFDWREYGLVVTESPITAHHDLFATGDAPVLVSRRVPAVPLHPQVKLDDRQRVLRVRLQIV